MIKLSTFQYTELATGGFTNRRCCHLKTIPQVSLEPAYSQYMQYGKDFQENYQLQNTAKFYYGKKYSPVFPLDIDCDDGQLEKLKVSVTNSLISFLQHYEINASALRIYFSGEKGFHIYIPSILFGIQPNSQLQKYFKKLGMQLAKDFFSQEYVDLSIYYRNSLLRLPNSCHQNSGLYKIPLTFNELCTMSIEEIREMASEPRSNFEFWALSEFSPHPELQGLWRDIVSSKVNSHEKKIDNLLKKGVSKGKRHNTAFIISRGLKNDFSNDHEIEQELFTWNRRNNPPIEDHQIQSIVKSTKPFKGFHTPKDRYTNFMEYIRCDYFFGKLNIGHQACMIHLIARTNEYPKIYKGITIFPGQVSFALKTAASEIGVTVDKLRTFLTKAENEGCLKKGSLPDRSASIVTWEGELAGIFVGKNPTLESQSEKNQNPHTSKTEEALIP